MTALLYAGLVLLTVFFMEFVAWFAHKYVMHGFLWKWHEDHHKPHTVPGFFQKNDLFFLVFALPSAACYILGTAVAGLFPLLFVGIGISVYGLIYFLIHDVYIHRRFRWFRQLDGSYSRAILRAHGAHHAKQTKEGCESFGLLVVAARYFRSDTSTASSTDTNSGERVPS